MRNNGKRSAHPRSRAWAIRAALLAAVAGCGAQVTFSEGTCAPGSQVACPCGDGISLQVCMPDSTFGPCQCGGTASASGAGGSTTGAGAASSGGAVTSASGTTTSTGAGGALVFPHYSFEPYVGPAIWTVLTRATAIDADRLFVTDGQNVFVVEDGVPSVYLSLSDLSAVSDYPHVASMDVGPDGRLYILVYFPYQILVSDAPHVFSIHRDDLSAAEAYPALMGVETADRIMVVSHNHGMYEVTPGGVSLLYDDGAIQTQNCEAEDLALSQDGWLYYLPGCNGSPVLSGKTDGSGVGELEDPDDLGEYDRWNFGGIARNPPGGVMVNLVGTLYHLAVDGSATELDTTPALENLGPNRFYFHARPIEVGASGNVYVITADVIYRAVPD